MSRIQRTQGRGVTRLRVEQLEDRRLLAQYAFAINLYADDGGSPGELIPDDRIQAGDAFFVEITAEDLRTEPLGLEGLGLRIQWDPQVLEEIDSLFDPSASGSAIVTAKFPLFRGGWLDNQAGCIDLLHGMAFSSLGAGQVIGLDGPERFALLHFRAEQTAQDSPITLRPRGVGFLPMREYTNEDLTFEHQTVSVLEASSTLVTVDQDAPIDVTAPPVEPADETSGGTLNEGAGDATGGEPDDSLDTTGDADETTGPDEPLGSSDDSDLGTTVESLPSATWQNPVNPLDVDGLNGVTPLDALITINYLNSHAGDSALPPLAGDPPPFYYDINGDNLCTPHDALLVINFLKSAQSDSAEGESEPAVGQHSPAAASSTDLPPAATFDSAVLPQAKAPVVPPADPRRDAVPVVPWLAADAFDDSIDVLARAQSSDDASRIR